MRELTGTWRDLFRSFRIALDPRKITLAVAGITLSVAFILLTLLAVFLCRDEGVWNALRSSTADKLFLELSDALRFGSVTCPGFRIAVLAIVALACWPVWAYFGGAISRIAAVEIAKDERLTLSEALSFAKEKYRSIFWSPLAVIIAILFFGLCNAAVGLIGRIPGGVGQLLVSVPLILALFSGLLMALLTIGLVFGFPLMIPTICVEGTDAFDAISRSMSYVYARPWRYLWNKLVAVVYGIPCAAFIIVFAILMVAMGLGFGALGMGDAFTDLRLALRGRALSTMAGNVAAVFFVGWLYFVAASVLGYLVSYCLSSKTMIYMLLRKAEDGTEMTEVYEELEDGEDQAEEQAPPAEEKEEGGDAPKEEEASKTEE